MVNKKVLMSVLILGLAATVAGGETWAYFTDTATSQDNQFTAGTLKLKVGNGTDDFNFTVNNIKPGDLNQFAGDIYVENVGSINGTLTATLTNVSNSGFANLLNITVNGNKQGLVDGSTWDLGSLPSSGSKDLEFFYSWDDNDPNIDNPYQGASVAFDVKFNLKQQV